MTLDGTNEFSMEAAKRSEVLGCHGPKEGREAMSEYNGEPWIVTKTGRKHGSSAPRKGPHPKAGASGRDGRRLSFLERGSAWSCPLCEHYVHADAASSLSSVMRSARTGEVPAEVGRCGPFGEVRTCGRPLSVQLPVGPGRGDLAVAAGQGS